VSLPGFEPARRQKEGQRISPGFHGNRRFHKLMYLSAISRLFPNSFAKSRKNRDGRGGVKMADPTSPNCFSIATEKFDTPGIDLWSLDSDQDFVELALFPLLFLLGRFRITDRQD
jgi:hypothetical protein